MSFALQRSASYTELTTASSLDSVLQGAQKAASSKSNELAFRVQGLTQSRTEKIEQIAKLSQELTTIKGECSLLNRQIEILKNQNGSLRRTLAKLESESEEMTRRNEERIKSVIAKKNAALDSLQKIHTSQIEALCKEHAAKMNVTEARHIETIEWYRKNLRMVNDSSNALEGTLRSLIYKLTSEMGYYEGSWTRTTCTKDPSGKYVYTTSPYRTEKKFFEDLIALAEKGRAAYKGCSV